jgi:hypothetical protein
MAIPMHSSGLLPAALATALLLGAVAVSVAGAKALGARRSAPLDAATLPLPTADDVFWTAEERPVRLRLVSPNVRRAGQGIFLMSTVSLEESCVYPGPLIEVRGAPAGSPRQFRARVWRRHGVPCDRVDRLVEEPIHWPTRSAGTMRFDAGDGTVIEVKVSGKAPHIPLDDRDRRTCQFDDDCWATDLCVPKKSNPTGIGICGETCGSDLDCPSGNCNRKPGLVGICADRTTSCDDERRPCGWGQVCKRAGGYGTCEWPTELSAWTRGDCKTDRDCGVGLKCFKRNGEGAASGRCQMLCSSGGMSCTGAHICRDGICEWLGE